MTNKKDWSESQDGYTLNVPKRELNVFAKAAEQQHQRMLNVLDLNTGTVVGVYDAALKAVIKA